MQIIKLFISRVPRYYGWRETRINNWHVFHSSIYIIYLLFILNYLVSKSLFYFVRLGSWLYDPWVVSIFTIFCILDIIKDRHSLHYYGDYVCNKIIDLLITNDFLAILELIMYSSSVILTYIFLATRINLDKVTHSLSLSLQNCNLQISD